MIIDAREVSHPQFKPNSVVGAIYSALEPVEDGEHIDVHMVYDKDGRRVTKTQFRAFLSYLAKQGWVRVRANFSKTEKCFILHKVAVDSSRESITTIDVVLDARSDNPNPFFAPWTVTAALYVLLESHPPEVDLRVTAVLKRNGKLGNSGTVRNSVSALRAEGIDVNCGTDRQGKMRVRRLK